MRTYKHSFVVLVFGLLLFGGVARVPRRFSARAAAMRVTVGVCPVQCQYSSFDPFETWRATPSAACAREWQ
jgi:hypothetical protein